MAAATVYNRDKDIQAYARSEAHKIISTVNKGEDLHHAIPNFLHPGRKVPRPVFKYFMQTLMNNPASKVRPNSPADKRTFARVFIYELSAEPFMGGVCPTPDVGDEIDDLLDHISQQDVSRVMETTEASPFEIQSTLGATITFNSTDKAAAYLSRLRVTMNYLFAVRQHIAQQPQGKDQFTLKEVLIDIRRVCVHRASDFASVLDDMSDQITADLVASPGNNFNDPVAQFDIDGYNRALDAFFAIFKVTRDIKSYRAPISQRNLEPGNLAPPAPVGALNAMDLRHQLSSKRQEDRSTSQQDGSPASKRANKRDNDAVDQAARAFISQLRRQFPSTLRFEQDGNTVDAVGYVQANLFRLARKNGNTAKRGPSSSTKGGDFKNSKTGRKYNRDSGAGGKSVKH
jgi:hypothetical protein